MFMKTTSLRHVHQPEPENIEKNASDGYRAGIDVGQEECLQEGFNTSFTQSSKLLFAVSELRGIVSGKLSYQLMKPGVLSPDQEQLLQTLLGDIVEYETHLLKFSNELYSHLKQKEDSSCNSGAEINPGINNRLTTIVDDDETEYNIDIKDRSNTESRAGNANSRTVGENNLVSELTDSESQDASSLVKINKFKSRLKTILTQES
ncbi:uncharacterized protein LOC123531799 isoform X2 [Mercenaria mercenaria]|uniref:uncharacterized protein LOC123531799 isoform X2 n=1 Tax=Mercenaria mercenaria TaxID=6596 RepID=UPI00234F9712|nr:uncharacterized protein LOC123531799 isoform X2 [Mercenaria mercenaria]